ncbi:NADH oxidase [Talaromyces proteolyticus]|uniref:NADH oxidase n=1 Tax=Talaromyces proteolyticus TaxID=1131652 RepID=A0AAD4PSB7_9EURO|nr:NADH oxidase [Talaromyces proteolyticus]KAH8690802.1 NADH oxidase [Talaromyces proteolyticus]
MSTVDRTALARPLEFEYSGKTAKNRLFNAAMAEMLATWDEKDRTESGIPTEALINLYSRWAEGGWGTILTGNIQTQYLMLGNPGEMSLDPSYPFSGPRFEAFKRLARAGKSHGSLIIGQISHIGRKASAALIKEAVSASTLPMHSNNSGPNSNKKFTENVRAATKEDIETIVNGFVHAAVYLEKAGFDGVELHAAHGYLIAQFLSGATNKRTDEYGGSLQNRMRLLVEIGRGIRQNTSPGFVLGAKLNSVEFQKGGITPDEAQELCCVLQGEGLWFDFVELSGGNVEGLVSPDKVETAEKESTRNREAFFLDFAETIVPAMKQGAGEKRKTKVVLTGGIRSASGIVKALEVVDAVAMGRSATQAPSAAAQLISGEIEEVPTPAPPFDKDIGLGVVASTAQIGFISRGERPFDLADGEVAARFIEDLRKK